MNILVIDNYDSFTYNLVHILRQLGYESMMRVVCNDQFELDEVEAYTHILLSPGPGVPKDAGLMPRVIQRYAESKNILGICLGHQAIGEAFGSGLFNLPEVCHGVVTMIDIVHEDVLFTGLPSSFKVCRYHSWVVDKDSLPDDLIITAVACDGSIMAVKHRQFELRGVQFHPESVMTEHGTHLIKNWLA